MRLVIFLSILLLFASCRSNKELQREAVDTSHAEVQIQASSAAAASMLDLLRSASEIHLSGITVDFFPPTASLGLDSLHPDIRAAPKTIHVDQATVSHTTDAATLHNTESVGHEAINLRTDASTESKQESKSDVNALTPSGSVLVFSTLISIALVSIFAYLKFFRKF